MLTNLRDRRGPAWFFTGQAGCYCCPTTAGVYVVVYGLKQSPLVVIRDVDKYEIDTWTAKGDAPTPGRYFPGVATVSQVAYIFGGFSTASPFYLTDSESYVQSTDTFTAKSAMTAHRSNMAGMSIDGKVYSMAGLDDTGITNTRTAYQYTPSSDAWATKTDCPTPARRACRGYELSTKGYVVCGVDGSATTLKDNDQYDPSGDSWTSKADVDTSGIDERTNHAAYAIDGKGYLTHGNRFGTLLNEVAEYTVGTDSWAALTNTTTAREQCYGASLGGTSPGYTTGGLAAGSAASLKHDEFTPTSWTSRTDIPAPARYGHVSAESA